METPLGSFGAPPDAAAWAALVAAGALAFAALRHPGALRAVPDRLVVAALALLACLLSALYVVYYLRGGPRIVDATSYFLQARALSEGQVRFDGPGPSGSFRGRFLLATGDPTALAVLFPPGYPAVLALGFLVGAPLSIGPLIAAALVVATFVLAHRLFASRPVALLAAALSALSATLRYHTADTMSHGWSALLFAGALSAALGPASSSFTGSTRPRAAALSGLLVGWLVATRPVSGVVASLIVAAALRGWRARGIALMAAAPLGGLFLGQQRLATGSWFVASQSAYYAVADGPPGCFGYGFGDSIGCLVEHGDFVRARLAEGYGAIEALGTTLRRMKAHLADAANAELFVIPLVLGAIVGARDRQVRILASGPLGLAIGYAPFYFDGNYPGGGARFFADALPFEHVLLAWALHRFGVAALAPSLALAGFALHTAFDHVALRDRDGGRPMYEAGVVERAGITRGIVFVETDHGFSLGFDPAVRRATDGIVVARLRRDAHDVLLWEALGRPPAALYRYDPGRPGAVPAVVPHSVTGSAVLRFEAEAEWPPLEVAEGWVGPEFPACASGGRGLGLRPLAGRARATVQVTVPATGDYEIRAGWSGIEGPGLEFRLREARWRPESPGRGCVSAAGPNVHLPEGSHPLSVQWHGSTEAVLDYVDLSPARGAGGWTRIR